MSSASGMDGVIAVCRPISYFSRRLWFGWFLVSSKSHSQCPPYVPCLGPFCFAGLQHLSASFVSLVHASPASLSVLCDPVVLCDIFRCLCALSSLSRWMAMLFACPSAWRTLGRVRNALLTSPHASMPLLGCALVFLFEYACIFAPTLDRHLCMSVACTSTVIAMPDRCLRCCITAQDGCSL